MTGPKREPGTESTSTSEPTVDAKRSLSDQLFRGLYLVSGLIAVGLIVGVIGLGIGLAQGYRPVVLTSGSMSPVAPTGSLIIAQPVDRVDVGDILVMSNEARATVTHRIVEIERSATGEVFAVTRGDANEEIDAAPFPLEGPQLIGRWILPEFGTALLWLGSPFVGLIVVGGGVLILTMSAISYIWSSSAGKPRRGPARRPVMVPARQSSLGQKRFGIAIGLAVLFGLTGIAWSLYLATGTIPGNAFSTADCFDARVGSVQSGRVISTTDGATSVTISAVDPARSFVVHSVRSNNSIPGESVILSDLSGPTTIDFLRQTSTPTPDPVVIDWSVVEYSCGVTVQRGTVPGNGAQVLDVPVTPVESAQSFLLGGSIAAPSNTGFDNDDQSIVELVNGDTVRFRLPATATHTVDRTLGFQLVTFADSGDARTAVVSTTLGAGQTVDTISLAQPVNPGSTMVIATTNSSNTGGSIGDRTVRVRLLDSTTVEVVRSIGTGSVEVDVQVVELLEGTTVQSGIVDLSASQSSETVAIAPVDATRTTVGSTVLIGSAWSGGSTDEAASGEIGEAMVSVDLVDPTTLTIERVAIDSQASFAWQAITWGGPGWADPDSPFRQRIDVDAASVDVPSGYTTPVDIDHQALVASGLSEPSGDDLRLWRFDGLAWTELDRVLDEGSSWDSPTTRLMFRTQESVSASATVSYWLYFGDPTPAPPLENRANVYLIDEGFEGGLGFFEDRTEGTAWYRADPWTQRIELTVDAATVASNLSAQTVLVDVVDAGLGGAAQADGSDIVFTDAGGTILAHEIESWTPGTGALTAWVLVPTIDAATDTTMYLTYGAPDAPRQEQPRALWAGRRAVWHLARDVAGPAPALDDVGPNNIDGVAFGETTTVASPTGFAARLDGVGDRLESAPVRLSNGALSSSVWFRADALSGDVVLVAQGDPAATGVLEIGIDTSVSPTGFATLQLDGATVTVSGGSISPGTWHHLAMVWDQTTLDLVLDGAVVGSTPAAGALPAALAAPVTLGGDAAGLRTLDGDLDQVTVRDGAVSIDRLAFEFANLANPATTVAVGSTAAGTYLDQGDWSIRRPITVSSALTDTDIVDFPLLVELTDLDLAGTSQADGDDLVFTAADGVTRLDHLIEQWDSGSGALTAWVRIPLLSSSVDTEIFLYTGNPLARYQGDPVGVWSEDSDLVLQTP